MPSNRSQATTSASNERSSKHASATSPWTTIPLDIFSRLIDYLKEEAIWSCVCRSLRLVNKYWSDAVNAHVRIICPHKSRILRDEDIFSLLKFRNLTSISAAPFLYCGLKGPSTERYQMLMQATSGLPLLSEMHLTVQNVDGAMLDRLHSIVNLRCLRLNGGLFDETQASHLKGLHLQELSGDFTGKALSSFLPHMPSLKHLDVLVFSLNTAHQAKDLSKVENVSLRMFPPQNHLLRHILSLVSLELNTSDPTDINHLISLPKLRRLVLIAQSMTVLRCSQLTEVVSRLDAFEVTIALSLSEDYDQEGTFEEHRQLPISVLSKADGLKELSATLITVDEEALSIPTGLTKLTMDSCRLLCHPCVLESFQRLRELQMKSDIDLDGKNPIGKMSLSKLSELRRLRIDVSDRELFSASVQEMSQLTQLQSLFMHHCFKHLTCAEEINQFAKMAENLHLTELGISGSVHSRAMLDEILKMPFLKRLEKLSCFFDTDSKDKVWADALMHQVRVELSNVKVEWQ